MNNVYWRRRLALLLLVVIVVSFVTVTAPLLCTQKCCNVEYRVEVMAGVNPGDSLVTGGPQNLQDGDTVRVLAA